MYKKNQRKTKYRRVSNNCEYCDDCLYICEGDFICSRFGRPVLVKVDWTPNDYYSNCKACKNYIGEE